MQESIIIVNNIEYKIYLLNTTPIDNQFFGAAVTALSVPAILNQLQVYYDLKDYKSAQTLIYNTIKPFRVFRKTNKIDYGEYRLREISRGCDAWFKRFADGQTKFVTFINMHPGDGWPSYEFINEEDDDMILYSNSELFTEGQGHIQEFETFNNKKEITDIRPFDFIALTIWNEKKKRVRITLRNLAI